MKRFISILLAVLFAAMLAGCGRGEENTDPVGKYVLKSIDGKSVETIVREQYGSEGSGYENAELEELLERAGIGSVDEYMTIELKADGTTEANSVTGEHDVGSWKREGDKISVTSNGETAEITIKGGVLSFTYLDSKYVFIKK